MPRTFLFHTVYEPGTLEAVSYRDGQEVSRARLTTAGMPEKIRLVPETDTLKSDGESLAYVRVELTDAAGIIVPDAAVRLSAEADGTACLQGFGTGNPITEDNYTRGECVSFRGAALAVLRSGYEPGETRLKVTAEGLGAAEITLPVIS